MSKMNSKLILALVLPLGMALGPPIASSAQSDTVTAALDAARAASQAAIPDGPAKEAGIFVGEDAAAVMPLLRVGDGWDATMPYTPGTNPGDWQPAPPAYAAAFLPGCQVTPFGLEGSQYRLSSPPAQPPGGGSDDSVTTTVIVPVSAWAETCMISGNLKAILTATPEIGGTASVVFKLKPMGCKGSCGVVNGQFTFSTTVTIGAGVVFSCPLKFNTPQCHHTYADATCQFLVNADGTAIIDVLALLASCSDY